MAAEAAEQPDESRKAASACNVRGVPPVAAPYGKKVLRASHSAAVNTIAALGMSRALPPNADDANASSGDIAPPAN